MSRLIRKIIIVVVILVLLSIPAFFLLKNFQFFGLGAILYGILTDGGGPPDITIVSPGVPDRTYGPAISDLERCDLLRQAVKDAKANDTILLGAGVFDCDGPNKGTVLFPENVTVIGQGMDNTKLFSVMYGDDQGNAFEVRGGTYQDMSFESKSAYWFEDERNVAMWEGLAKTEDGKNYLKDASGNKVVINPFPGPWTLVMERVKMVAQAWNFYHWNNQAHRYIFRDCVFISGRQGISLMNNNSLGHTTEIINSVIDVDTYRSTSSGAVSDYDFGGGYGVVARGGASIKITGSTFNIKCERTGERYDGKFFTLPNCAALYDGNGFGSASATSTIEFTNNTISLKGGTVATYLGGLPSGRPINNYDILMTQEGTKSKLKVEGGCGSGPNCAITANWTQFLATSPPQTDSSPKSITLTFPEGGENLAKGQDYNIRWVSNNLPPDDPIDIILKDSSGREVLNIASSSVSSQIHTWNIPADLSGSFKIRLRHVASGVADENYGTFTINDSAVVSQPVVEPLTKPSVPSACVGITLTRILQRGFIGTDVKCVQALLNTNSSTQVAVSGPGSPGNETLYYGPLTVAAVKKFQAIHGTGLLGIVGPKTGAKMNQILTGVATPPTIAAKTPTPATTKAPTATTKPAATPIVTPTPKPIVIVSGPFKRDLSFGDKGSDVTALQELLKSLGPNIYPEAVVDGYFGEETKKGVQRFQVKYGLSKPGLIGFGSFGAETRSKANSIINSR